MQKKAAEKLHGVERHDALSIAVSVVLPGESDGVATDGEDASISDGDTVGVASKIFEDLFGSAEGWLRVDDPVFVA